MRAGFSHASRSQEPKAIGAQRFTKTIEFIGPLGPNRAWSLRIGCCIHEERLPTIRMVDTDL